MVENVFYLPGLGRLIFQSISNRDLIVVRNCVMLLAAMVSALVVVADQLMNTWVDGHLMVAWMALWLVGFAALALFAGASRKLAVTVVSALKAWSQRVARARSDERLWAIARTDQRVMSDLNAAIYRSER